MGGGIVDAIKFSVFFSGLVVMFLEQFFLFTLYIFLEAYTAK